MDQAILKIIKEKGTKESYPEAIEPMLCTLVKEPIDDPDFLYEVKWDGYRIIAFSRKRDVKLSSRSGLDYTNKYPPIVKALKTLKLEIVLDGEIVVLNETGKPDFDALQKYNGDETPIFFYVFDLLYAAGYSLMQLPLVERKQLLEKILANNEVIKYSMHFDDGPALYRQVQSMEMEGIIAKHRHSSYKPGQRGKQWLKIPTEIRQEFVIGGWVESDRGRPFASLLFGAYNNKQFEWIGHGGGGFKEAEMPGILRKLQALETPRSPFMNKVDASGVVHWVKPELVANFKFATWTRSGRIRKPAIFLGFRKDKKAKDVVREIPKDISDIAVGEIARESAPEKRKKGSGKTNPGEGSNWVKIDLQKITSRQQFELDDCSIELSNVEKEIWKGITKAELIEYYHSVYKYIAPHLKDRPQSLHIKPVNANAPGFYIKDMEGHEPDCAAIFTDKRKHKKAGKRDVIDYLVCNNEATLLYMINLGCIDVNPWTARIKTPNQPDYIVIDLDPTDEDFKKVIETALAAKQYFAQKKLQSFIKTSGKTGMHLLLPCRDIDFATARDLAEYISTGIHKLVPRITTTEVSIDLRGNKLYIDPNQNDYADTIAAPYTARPFRIPAVSAPLEWKEVNSRLDPAAFTIRTMGSRIEKKGELFAQVMNETIARKNTTILLKLLQGK